MLRTEVDILHARMRAFEMEIKDIKEQNSAGHKNVG
jgi:hypothetical protein